MARMSLVRGSLRTPLAPLAAERDPHDHKSHEGQDRAHEREPCLRPDVEHRQDESYDDQHRRNP